MKEKNTFSNYSAESTTKPESFSFFSHNPLKVPRYPYSGESFEMQEPCPWCGYGRGLIIIRYSGDVGFCRCGRCDAALFSLNEMGGVR